MITNTLEPDEILLQIFEKLDNPQDLANCCQVNKQWSCVAADHNLWKRFYREISIDCELNRRKSELINRTISTIVEIPANVEIKQLFTEFSLNTLEEIIRRVDDFTQKIRENQIGSFKCYFAFNPGCLIDLQFGFGKVNNISDPHLKEIHVFTGKLENEGINTLTRETEIVGSGTLSDYSVTLPKNNDWNIAKKINKSTRNRVTQWESEKENRTRVIQIAGLICFASFLLWFFQGPHISELE